MNTRILLLGLATSALTSCATAYRTGQTPDDVYYSPVKAEEESYVKVDKDEDRYRYNNYGNLDDRRLRMHIRNRNRYNACYDDWYWDNWSGTTSWRYGWNNPWTWNSSLNNGWYYSYNSWCYSPYPARSTVYVSQKTFNYKPPIRNFGNSNTVAIYNPKTGSGTAPSKTSARVYNNSNRSGSGFGSFLRQILLPSTGNNNSSYNSGNNTRTYNPSSSGSSSSGSSSSSSSGSSARPARNGKGG
ncbi:MAG TPA: hypothetical protein VFN30_04845 [Chitinophagaceae bacterium]|nr:hypothetical protein [Chitinophagaceae bacterium]